MTRLEDSVRALLLLALCIQHGGGHQSLADFLTSYEREAPSTVYNRNEAAWAMSTNYTAENAKVFQKASIELSTFMQRNNRQALVFLRNDSLVLTADDKRRLRMIADIGKSAQTDKVKLKRLTDIESEMKGIYSTAEVCLDSSEKCLKLEPGLSQVMMKSRDCHSLLKAWQGWRDQSGKKMKHLFPEYVQLSNEAVQILGHEDMGAYWRSLYDTETFEEDIARLWEQVSPLYQQLHSYVRRKLKGVYGPEIFPASGHIPAHLLGNMWAQTWEHIGELVKPYKNKHLMDTTGEMKRQGYTVKRMFETSEEFFYSLGFDNMTEVFWNKSMFVRPEGREVECHASAWDMHRKDDFRIKMCSVINHENLMIIHHEMGHIQYFMEYNHQPVSYRNGANPGFHEAVGDTISKAVQTPTHLKTIGLLSANETLDKETDINFLMQIALYNIAFLPFGYLIDQWRWSVFRGDTPPESYNGDWWKLRCKLQGVSPPVNRSSEDFDPGAKYHVASSTPYVRYFVSFVIQFQFYKAACDAAGNTEPLHRCDFYKNKDAGDKMRSMLQLGNSKPWPDAMEKITGQRHMDARPLMEYFQPLLEYLEGENGDDFGWEDQCPELPPSCRDGVDKLGHRPWIVVLCAVLSVGMSLLQMATR